MSWNRTVAVVTLSKTGRTSTGQIKHYMQMITALRTATAKRTKNFKPTELNKNYKMIKFVVKFNSVFNKL